ncbi:MAG TPA: cytochrome P450 [Burkholderiales bacterium]|nr:cytochrome P450 [Burkholderiales bacterium]
MAVEAKKLGLWDSVRFLVTVVVPQLLRGSLAPSRFWLPILVRLNSGQWSAATINAFRRKYKCDRLWVHFVIQRTLLVLDGEGMAAVLNSDANQADPRLKAKSLRKLAPESVLISSGVNWRARRDFNEEVLDTPRRRHRHADAFIDVVFSEVDRLLDGCPEASLDWRDFRALARRISQQVLLGSECLRPELSTEVDHLVDRANWFFLPVCILHPGYLASFYGKIRKALQDRNALSRCLLRQSAEQYPQPPEADRVAVEDQVAFWVFVIRDALELHVTRTLALIAAHPQIQSRIRRDVAGASGNDLREAARLEFVECCVREQLRLWTPIPVLLRRVTDPFRLPDDDIDLVKGEQVMLYPGYYHRDPQVFGHLADQFCPEHAGAHLPPTYYFSDGRQRCAGQNLALLLVKFTLGALLAKYRFDLDGPKLDASCIPVLYDHFHVRFRATGEAAVHANQGARGARRTCHA